MKLRRIFALLGLLLFIFGCTPLPSSTADICEWDEVTDACKG